MPRRNNGVSLALKKLIGDEAETPETRGKAASRLAEILGVTQPAIYMFLRSGYFPLDRAKVISAQLDIPLADLVRGDIREALLANNS